MMDVLVQYETNPSESTPPTPSSPTTASNSLSSSGNKLTSPNLTRKNNGTLDDKLRGSGVVEKLVSEFQLYYTENNNKDTYDPSTSPQNRRHNTENRNVPTHNNKKTRARNKSLKRKGNINITQKTNHSSSTTTTTSTSTTKSKTIDSPPIKDDDKPKHQQQFKSLTNDLLKNVGSVVLKPVSNPSSRSSSPSRSSAPSIPSVSSTSTNADSVHPIVPLSSSPPISQLLNKKTPPEDDKGFKRQISKTLEPTRANSPPPSFFLSNSAPAHVNPLFSTLSNKPPSTPPSPSSSPRLIRASMNAILPSSSPLSVRSSRGSPVIVLSDISTARAALNPVGLPLERTSSSNPNSPTSGSTPTSPNFLSLSTSPIFPKPLRPISASKKPTPPELSSESSSSTSDSTPCLSQSTPESSKKSLVTENLSPSLSLPGSDRNKENGTSDIGHNGELSPRLRSSHPSAFSTLSSSPPSNTPPLSPSSSTSELSSWTPCRPMSSLNTNSAIPSAQHRSKPSHRLSRPMSTIGLVRYGSHSPNGAGELMFDPDFHHSLRTSSPFNPSPTSSPTTSTPTSPNHTSLPPLSPTLSRIHSTPLSTPPLSSSPVISSSPSSELISTSYSSTATSSTPSSTNTSPTNSALDLKSIASHSHSHPLSRSPPQSTTTTPFLANLQLFTALSLVHNSRRSIDSIPSFTDSPRDSPCGSPSDSPRPGFPSSESPRSPSSESPKSWAGEEYNSNTNGNSNGWRSPVISSHNSSSSAATTSPPSAIPNSSTYSSRAGARTSVYGAHRLTRMNSSTPDLISSTRSSPESPVPLSLGGSGGIALGQGLVAGRARGSSGNSNNSGVELGIRRPREGSSGDGARSRENSGGSSSMPVRSNSDPFVPQVASHSPPFDKDDSNAPPTPISILTAGEDIKAKSLLTRSVSAWQLGKSSNEFAEEGDSEEAENRSDLIYTHTRTGLKIVKAGTLNALIEVLTWQKQSDPAFVDAFLLTYPSFTTPSVLLDKLVERYNQTPPMSLSKEQKEEFENDILVVRLKVCSVLKSWADKYYYDFQKEPQLVERFVIFMETLKDRGMEKVAGMIVRALYKKLDGSGKKIISTPSMAVPPAVIPKGEITLLNFDDLEVARQLTLMEYDSYCCIRPRECLNQAWNKPNREEESPNIVTMIRRSNIIPLWVATEIIKEDKLQRRVTILKKFISIAEHCRNLNNFNGVMEIISGLNLTPVYRLRKTWDALSKKYVTLFEQLTALMAPKGNFKVYREELHTKDPPCVPFLGRYLTDLTFVEELAKDVGEGMINFVKRMQLSVVIREIQQYQQTPYNLTIVAGIREYLAKIYGFPEGELYTQSRMIEPPQQTS